MKLFNKRKNMETKTTLREIKEKVDEILNSYRNEKGIILDENGKQIGVIFGITDVNEIGITQGVNSDDFARLICSFIKHKSVGKLLHMDMLMLTSIQEQLVKFSTKSLLNFAEGFITQEENKNENI